MLDHFKNDLKKYHQLFNKVRCKAEGLEELIVFSIKSEIDNVTWKPSAHDKEVDIIVNSYKIQIKSGVIQNNKLLLSGHRLGRFNGELDQITEYLNNPISDIISVSNPKKKTKKHIYEVRYIDKIKMKGIIAENWINEGVNFKQINKHNIKFSLRPKMSWQIWWEVPLDITELADKIVID